VEVEGNILDVRWRNPHAHLKILMEDESGREVEWEVEGTSPTSLGSSGLRADFYRIGELVRIAGWPPVTERRE